jgi:hypothetical protein
MVRANSRGTRRLEEIGDAVGFHLVCPTMGPYSDEDMFGMGLAVCVGNPDEGVPGGMTTSPWVCLLG